MYISIRARISTGMRDSPPPPTLKEDNIGQCGVVGLSITTKPYITRSMLPAYVASLMEEIKGTLLMLLGQNSMNYTNTERL